MRCFIAAAVAGLLPTLALAAAPAPGFNIPVAAKKLANGMTIVVSEDHSAPTFGISTAFRIGFRLEPKGRTGFAHLFEHMMFEGTPVAPKGTLTRVIEGGGGVLNGSTRNDYTNYIASAPVSALDAILWLEADRMKHLDFSEKNLKNQQEVVKEEIRVNVKNRPYGLFFWTDLVAKALRQVGEQPRRLRLVRGPRRREPEGRGDLLRQLLRSQQRGDGHRGRRDTGGGLRQGREVLRRAPLAPAAPARRRRRGHEHAPSGRWSRRTRWPGCPRWPWATRSPTGHRQGLRGPRGAGRRPPERRRLAPLPGAGEGQGADAAGPGRRELPLREPLAEQRPHALRATSASTSRGRTSRRWWTRPRRRSRSSRPPGSPPPSSRG